MAGRALVVLVSGHPVAITKSRNRSRYTIRIPPSFQSYVFADKPSSIPLTIPRGIVYESHQIGR